MDKPKISDFIFAIENIDPDLAPKLNIFIEDQIQIVINEKIDEIQGLRKECSRCRREEGWENISHGCEDFNWGLDESLKVLRGY